MDLKQRLEIAYDKLQTLTILPTYNNVMILAFVLETMKETYNELPDVQDTNQMEEHEDGSN